MNSSEVVYALSRLKAWDELVVEGVLWTRLDTGEFKRSPHGLKEDYDTGCEFFYQSELEDFFTPGVQYLVWTW